MRNELRQDRWQQLLKDGNHARIWQALNWKEEVSQASHPAHDITQPSDVDFQIHFSEIFNPPDVEHPDVKELVSAVHIPVLDDPVSPREVEDQVRRVKAGKACEPDGVPPGVLKALPTEWLLCITTLFNNVFMSATYPIPWINGKLFTIY